MKISKYFNIDKNILIEYIYDNDNLIGEPYNILYNSKLGIKSFISADEIRPPVRGFKKTNNDLYNQLYKLDTIKQRYAKLPLTSSANEIDSDNYSFLQIKNFPISIPVRYDTIKVHMPINWTFDEKKGFYLRVFTYDLDNKNIIELSNFYFNITDIEQYYKLEYSSPILNINEQQWGKYVSVQIPSVSKVSEQRRFNITRENSINFNLSDGIGLSKNSPVFIDFQFIEQIETINNIDYFDVSSKISVVVPQKPEFEKLGVKIEESQQGDFFIIYGTYNGTIAEFNKFIEDSFYEGNRYYIEYKIEQFEKNTKTKTIVFPVNEDFNEPIEYRPIFKFTTTTAVIDVTMRLIDNVDGTFIERKASYGLLQGGGAKMGMEFNPRLNTGIRNIGAGDISKYARSLSKINLQKIPSTEVINFKSSISIDTSEKMFKEVPIIKLERLSFNLFSSNYYFISSDKSLNVGGINYIANNKSLINIYPFDNVLKFKIIKKSETDEIPLDLTIFNDLKMIIKSDTKNVSFDVYRDSDENDLEIGIVVFKITNGKYQTLKKINNSGYNLFYLVGKDDSNNSKVIYSGYFDIWDSISNITSIENNFNNIQSQIADPQSIVPIIEEELPVEEENIEIKGVNNTIIDTVSLNEIKKPTISLTFNPRWRIDKSAILLATTLDNYKNVLDIRPIEIYLYEIGFLKRTGINNIEQSGNVLDKVDNLNSNRIEYLFGYLKGINVNPNVNNITKLFENAFIEADITEYVNVGVLKVKSKKGNAYKESDVNVGEFLPDKKVINSIRATEILNQNVKEIEKEEPPIETEEDLTKSIQNQLLKQYVIAVLNRKGLENLSSWLTLIKNQRESGEGAWPIIQGFRTLNGSDVAHALYQLSVQGQFTWNTEVVKILADIDNEKFTPISESDTFGFIKEYEIIFSEDPRGIIPISLCAMIGINIQIFFQSNPNIKFYQLADGSLSISNLNERIAKGTIIKIPSVFPGGSFNLNIGSTLVETVESVRNEFRQYHKRISNSGLQSEISISKIKFINQLIRKK